MLIINSIPALFLDNPLSLEEYQMLSDSASLTSFSWNGVLDNYSGGYPLSAIIYAPFLFAISDSIILYKTIIVLNAAILSLIAPISFFCAKLLDIKNNYTAFFIALAVGINPILITKSSLVSGDIAGIISIWLILLFLLKAKNAKTKLKIILYSFLLGSTASIQGGSFYLPFIYALILIILFIYFKLLNKKCIFSIWAFLIGFAAFTITQVFIELFILSIFNKTNLNIFDYNIFNSWFDMIKPQHFYFSGIFSRLFYIISVSFGFAAIAITAAIVAIYKYLKKSENQKKSENIFILSFFLLIGLIGTITSAQADLISISELSKITDSFIPFIIFFGLIYLFNFDFNSRKIILSIFISIYLISAFYFIVYPIININDFYPQINHGINLFLNKNNNLFTLDSYSILKIISIILTIFIIILAASFCGKKNKSKYFASGFILLFIISSAFSANIYFSSANEIFNEEIASVKNVSSSVFNENGAPKISLYGLTDKQSAYLQFKNRKVKFYNYQSLSEIPSETLVVMSKYEPTTELLNGRVFKIGEADDIFIYAYGEQAINYAISKNIIEEWELSESDDALA